MVEQPQADRAQLVADVILVGQQILGGFAHCIGVDRPERRVLIDRQVRGRNKAVDLVAAGNQDQGILFEPQRCLEQMQLRQDIGLERVRRVGERTRDVRLAGEVHDNLGPHARQRRDHLVEMVQVGDDELDAPAQLGESERRLAGQAPHLACGGVQQVLGEVAADESIDAGN